MQKYKTDRTGKLPTRKELINQYQEAFNAFAKAGIDPTRHCSWPELYEAWEKNKQTKHNHLKATAKQFNCSQGRVQKVRWFMETEI